MEVDDRGEAAGDSEQVGVPTGVLTVHRCGHAAEAVPRTRDRSGHGVVDDREAGFRTGGRGAAVENSHDNRPGIGERVGGSIGIVIVGGDYHALARNHAKALHIGPDCLRQHHTGAVIVGEGQRPFDAAGGEDDLSGADVPEALGNAIRRDLARFDEALGQGDQIMFPIA